MSRIEHGVAHFMRRAEDFLHSARLLRDDLGVYGNSAALLAVHSAISLCDALTLHLGGTRNRSEAHAQAANRLEKILRKHKRDTVGIRRLGVLLGWKSDLAYGDKRIDAKAFERLVVEAQRFFEWAYVTFPELAKSDL